MVTPFQMKQFKHQYLGLNKHQKNMAYMKNEINERHLNFLA